MVATRFSQGASALLETCRRFSLAEFNRQRREQEFLRKHTYPGVKFLEYPTHIGTYLHTLQSQSRVVVVTFIGGDTADDYPDSINDPTLRASRTGIKRLPSPVAGKVQCIHAQVGHISFLQDKVDPHRWRTNSYYPLKNAMRGTRGHALGSFLEILAVRELLKMDPEAHIGTTEMPKRARRKQLHRIGLELNTFYPADQWIEKHAGAVRERLLQTRIEHPIATPNIGAIEEAGILCDLLHDDTSLFGR